MALSIFEIFDGEPEERRRQKRAKGIRKSIKEAGQKDKPKKQFSFFGAFNSQADAKKKAKEVGGFVKESNGRFYVKKEK